MEERKRPHIIVKRHPARAEEQRRLLTDQIFREVMGIAKCPERSVSVAFAQVTAEWPEGVYRSDLLERQRGFYLNNETYTGWRALNGTILRSVRMSPLEETFENHDRKGM